MVKSDVVTNHGQSQETPHVTRMVIAQKSSGTVVVLVVARVGVLWHHFTRMCCEYRFSLYQAGKF